MMLVMFLVIYRIRFNCVFGRGFIHGQSCFVIMYRLRRLCQGDAVRSELQDRQEAQARRRAVQNLQAYCLCEKDVQLGSGGPNGALRALACVVRQLPAENTYTCTLQQYLDTALSAPPWCQDARIPLSVQPPFKHTGFRIVSPTVEPVRRSRSFRTGSCRP